MNEKQRGRPKKRPQPKHFKGLGKEVSSTTLETTEQDKDTSEGQTKRSRKSLTVEDLQKCGQVHVLSVITDLNDQECITGPWEYCNAMKCVVNFTREGSGETYSLRLDSFLERGIPKSDYSPSLRFRWYSWIQFKWIAKQSNIPISLALKDEKRFIALLQEVNVFYRKSSHIARGEGLEPNQGPQCFADSTNLERLYYYGKGTCKYYRKTTMLQVIEQRYGLNVKAEYMVNASTPLIDDISYEDILKEVNRELSKKFSRHLSKLKKYAGPQCHEDRIQHMRVNYDVKFTSASSKARSLLNATSTVTGVSNIEHQFNEENLIEFFLRKCQVCNKIRWLGKRAAEKFVLGTYLYGEVNKHVFFSCNSLHDTSCEDEQDIVSLSAFEEFPQLWVAYTRCDDYLPPVCFVMRTLRPISIGIYDVEIIAKYACSTHDLSKLDHKAVCTKSMPNAQVQLGQLHTTGRFKSYVGLPILSMGILNRQTPREALVCQSWLDHCLLSSEDPSANFTVSNLSGIRDLHAAYNTMKMIHCSQCGKCSPGFEADAEECVKVPEAGKEVPLTNPLLLRTLKQSQILSNSSVQLDLAFIRCRFYKDGNVTGVCTDCSKYCEIDHNGIVTSIHDKSCRPEHSSQESQSSQEPIQDNISNINPYCVGNLMALDVFQDQASSQYAMFMDTLSRAEKLVLSPIHAVICILRSRTNNIPFSRHGSISFAVKEPVKTKTLPWHTFQRLPFVVMVSKHEDGSVDEAKVNMAKIVHAKELMEREVTCPVYGTRRPFYRFCDKVHTPFTTIAMETLASQLSDTNIAVLPDGLRKLHVDLVHERATKRLTLDLFAEWLNSGFTIGSGIKDAFIIENHKLESNSLSSESVSKQLWPLLIDFVRQTQNLNGESVLDEDFQITLVDVVRYAVEKGWLDPSNDVASASQDNLDDVLLPTEHLKSLTYLCCEEIELLLRESSNDEGNTSSVAQGGVVNPQTACPEEILSKGIQSTVLERMSAPEVDRQHPVAEDTPGYLQMAFPDVFLTGDACPHQQRPRSIKNASGNYKFQYYKWVCQQPRAMVNTELQFLINSHIKRQHSKGKAKLALKSDVFDKNGIPVKEDLIQNAQLRDWTVSNLMMFKSSIPDTTPFWKRSRDDAIAVQRDWEETVPWRDNKTPMSVMLFQTRAPPYNHHPAIHHLCPDAERLSLLSDEAFQEGRRRNVLQYPSIISFMCALMAEMDTKFLSKLRYDGDRFFTRYEWGANANPHSHRLYFSREFSQYMESLKQSINDCLQSSKEEAVNTGQDLSSNLVQESIRTKVLNCWDHVRQEYIRYMRPFYTSWNAGLLAHGKDKTFDFNYDRKSTICRLDMANVIDQALTTGQFSTLDTIYVSVANGTCRHLGHTGINDQPAKTDKCAVMKKKRVKNTSGKNRYKEIVTCKRRKPQPTSKTPTIEPDLHNKKLVQLQFECNDKWFNGHDPFEILHILSNADDKAVVPEFLRKPPEIHATVDNEANGDVVDYNLEFFSDVGDSATEYITKYAFKDAVTTKTSSDVLVTAMEKLEDGEPINQGTVQKMYNVHAIAGTTSIFQATHLNQKIPHVLSNVNIKHCSVSGLSLLRTDYNPEDGDNYIIPPLIKQFDGRHDNTSSFLEYGKDSKELKEEIQKDMCLHQFCDLYDVKEVKSDAEGSEGKRNFVYKRRSSARLGRFNALKLIPCHGLKVANPNDKFHWRFCRTLCLWKIPCRITTDFIPSGNDNESIKKGWIDLFNKTFVDGNGLPPWAYKFWKHYNRPRDNNSDTSSDEDDEENQHVEVMNDLPNKSDNVAKDCASNSDDDAMVSRPKAHSGNEQFYQNPIDRLRGIPQTMSLDQDNLQLNIESSAEYYPDNLANPEGVDFMDNWLEGRAIPSIPEIHARMSDLVNTEGVVFADSFAASTLNEKQQMAHDMVVQYVDSRLQWDKNDRQGPAPKPLRLVLMGNPGTGKSWTLKCFMSTLINLIGSDIDSDGNEIPAWTDKIKLAAPTGAASSQMYFKAETLHRLFSIPINMGEKELHLGENSAGLARLLLNFDPKKFILLVIDEFSMVSRQMFAFLTERLDQCHIDFNNIGIVLIGDPAQILPIASDPLWSGRLHTDQGKESSSISVLGMTRFRELFNFSPLQTLPNYDEWINLTKSQDRLLSNEITAYRKNLMKCHFDAVFLTEVKRTDNDSISQQFTGKILVNLRYGKKCREKEMNFLRQHCATNTEVKTNKEWRTAHIIHGYHFHSKDHQNRASVESDNAKALLKHHKLTGNSIMRIDSLHRPAAKSNRLAAMSAKEFEGAAPKWHACRGMRVMLLRNISPSIGLYNGSIHTLIGPIYNNDTIEVSLTLEHLNSAILENCVTTVPIDTFGKEKQIPPKSVLLSVGGIPYDKNMLKEFPLNLPLICKFQFPRNPPAMPDFMVIEAGNYSGPDILKLPGCENYIPIAPVESHKPDKSKKSKMPQSRIAFPLEGGDAATSFKGQGANYPFAEVDLDGWFHVPGIFLVAISRVRSPTHLHIRAFPNYMDLKLQRLKENVLDAQAFEEAIRVKSEWLYRHQSTCKDDFWNKHTNLVADAIIEVAIINELSIKHSVDELVSRVQSSCKNIDKNVILEVVQKLIETSEYLVAEPAPNLTKDDYYTLINYQKSKSVQLKVGLKDTGVDNHVKPIKSAKNKCEKIKKVHSGQQQPCRNDDYYTLVNNQKSKVVQLKVDLKDNGVDKHAKPLKSAKNKCEKTIEVHSGQQPCPNDASVPRSNYLRLKRRPDIASGQTFKGLQNRGNNVCFLNATIMALVHTNCFDLFLRQMHDMHEQCTGQLLGNNQPCPLCALYEICNRAYGHHVIQIRDIPIMPIIQLTKSLLPEWHIGAQYDADDFMTALLRRLNESVGCQIHTGTCKTTKTCQFCSNEKIKQQAKPIRLTVYMSQFFENQITIQNAIDRWLSFENEDCVCDNCGKVPHNVRREFITAPKLLMINVNRYQARQKTLVDHEVIIGNLTYIFRSSINYHPGHFTVVGSPQTDHYVYYSDELVHTCRGSLSDSDEHCMTMNRVKIPLEDNASVLLYELQM